MVRQKEQFTLPAHPRNIAIDSWKPKVQTIVGPRRSVKSSLLRLAFARLLQKKWAGIKYVLYLWKMNVCVLAAFHQYLTGGGYPETVNNVDAGGNQQLLQEYFNAVLYRDIIDQQQPANYGYLRYLFHRIAANTGKTIGLRKFFQELKSRGFAISQGFALPNGRPCRGSVLIQAHQPL